MRMHDILSISAGRGAQLLEQLHPRGTRRAPRGDGLDLLR